MEHRSIDSLITALIRLKYPAYNPAVKDPQDKDIAIQFGVSAQVFSNYKLGKRTPDPKHVKVIANAWSRQLQNVNPADRRRRLMENGFSPDNDLVAEFTRHLAAASLPTGGKDRRLRVSSLDFGGERALFSGSNNTFFFRFVNRYASQLGIQPDIISRTPDVVRSLDTGDVDLLLCRFASTSRITNERFFTTPLRISLGAVTHSLFSEKARLIARSLYLDQLHHDVVPLRPIVVAGEVGFLHCRDTLGLSEDRGELLVHPHLDDAKLTDLLKEECHKWLRAGDKNAPIPVVVVDEYTALLVFQNMGQTGLYAVPLSTDFNNQRSRHRRELPQYLMSIACSRKRKREFWEFLLESLSLFISVEVNTTAHLLADLFWRLEDAVFNAIRHLGRWSDDDYVHIELPEYERRLLAREYAICTLSLDRSTVDHESYPKYWQTVLRRTRELIFEEMVTDETHQEAAKKFIRSILALSPEPQLVTPSQLNLLTRYIDQHIKIDKYRGHYEGEIFALLRTSLAGVDEPEEEIDVKVLDPNNPAELPWNSRRDVHVNGVKELLNQLSAMYKKLPDPLVLEEGSEKSVGTEIHDKIGNDLKDQFGRYARIVMAIATRQTVAGPAQYPAGIVCILAEPGCREGDYSAGADCEHLSRCCELRYLWVADRYRHRNVSRLLLGHAVRWCREEKGQDDAPKYQAARVAILPQLAIAIEHVRQMGFSFKQELQYDKDVASGRFIFEKEL